MQRPFRQAFTLVELLTVVLVITVIAAIAVPVAQSTQRTSAARSCTANIAGILRAEAAYGTRFGIFTGSSVGDTTTWIANYTAGASGVAPTGGLVGAPEGLAAPVVCPLSGKAYKVTVSPSICTVECQDALVHVSDTKWTSPGGGTTTTGGGTTTTGGGTTNTGGGGNGNGNGNNGGGTTTGGGTTGGGGTVVSLGPWSKTITMDGRDQSNP